MHASFNKPFKLYAVRWRRLGDTDWRLYLIDSPLEGVPASPATFTFLKRAKRFATEYTAEFPNLEAEPVEIKMELFPAW